MHSDIRALGAELVAISPQSVGRNVQVRITNKLGFPVLSDPGNGYAHELGIAFAFGDELRRVYTRLGLLLPAFNGDESWELPLPTRIVVSSDGIVRRIDADPDYTRRPDPGETLQVLSAL